MKGTPGPVSKSEAATLARSGMPNSWFITRFWSWLVIKVATWLSAKLSATFWCAVRMKLLLALLVERRIASAVSNSNATSTLSPTYFTTSNVGLHTSPTVNASGFTSL